MLDWELISRLYASGDGTKAIAKSIGCGQSSIREGLIKRGLYQFGQNRKRNQSGVWSGRTQELMDDVSAWRAHDKWWSKAYRATPMDRYYDDHLTNKKLAAKRARDRYYRVCGSPKHKAKVFARNQLSRIRRQALGYAKTCRTHEYLGCTYQEAADHITKQLPPQWTWENYGKAWEIDHIIQLSDGSLTDPAHLKRVCHFTNLRPASISFNRARPRGAYYSKQRI